METDKAGYTCKFVEEPPKLFKCEICRFVLRDPQLTECCGKNVCRPCIAKVVEKDGACPIVDCRERCVKIGNVNRDLRFEILESVVYCTMQEAGCQWTDKLEKLDSHLGACLFVEEQCGHSCGVRIQRRLIKDHEAICERFLVECHQCGAVNERKNQPSHLIVCPLSSCKCPFNIVGCTSEILNKDMQLHLDEGLSEHYALVTKHSEAVRAEISESKVLAEISKKFDPQITDASTLNDEVMAAALEMAELKKAIEETENEFEELQEKHDRVVVQIAEITGEAEATLCMLGMDQSMAVSQTKVRCYGPALPMFQVSSRPPNAPRVTEEYIPTVSFEIRDFFKERRNDSCLNLPPFFSHRGGYKMSLIVYCNGYKEANGNYLSVFVSVLMGPYDNYLNWPMKCKVNLELVSAQIGTQNLKRTIGVEAKYHTLYDDIPQCCTVCGDAYLINHNLLSLPSKYLDNGCLKIQVTNII